MALDNKNNISVGKSYYQDSSFRQLTGRAEYIDDIPLSENTLHGALILSEIPSGMITSIETEKAKKFDPSITVITCLLYTSPSPRDLWISRMPSSA